ncbi:MAG: response regulator [Selenomonadaceae bacterium]|nr:response regulator [Selenomonadaceae bacterium]
MALTVERKVCPRCGRTFSGRPSDKLCGICSAVAPAGAYQDKNEINQRTAVRDYVKAHPGATDSEIINNLGISKRTLRDMSKVAQTFKNGVYHPCARCGKKILEGIYCSDCLTVLRNEAKVQGERNDYKRRIVQEEAVAVKSDNIILVVDADDLNLNMTKHILEMGMPAFKISTANNQIRAMNVMHQLKTRLLLLDDAVSHNYDGMSILRSVREDNLCKNVKVMMTTAQAKRENVSRGILMGALDYINKPFDPKNLIDRVNKALMAEAIEFTSRTIFKILLIDDNVADMEIEKSVVSKNFSCEILTASNGVEGLWILQDNVVDLVMVSLEMSFMDGLKILAFIRKDPKLKGLPVIIMTNSNDPTIINSVTNSSVRGYIRKPLIDEEGLLLIKNALNEGKYWR